MKAKITFLLPFIAFLTFTNLKAQGISATILDSITKQPIAFASVVTKKMGTISNEEGKFKFTLKKGIKPTDTLTISCLGYTSIAKPISAYTNSIIYLSPKINELKSVFITTKKYTAEEIIAEVKKNMTANYNTEITKKRLFFRESNHQKVLKNKYTLKKSTIKEINKSLLDGVMYSIPKKTSYYTEILCDLYGKPQPANQKIKLIKACELYDKNSDLGLRVYEKKFTKILEKNVKKDSYFKVKSGWFGTKIEAKDFFKTKIDSSNTEALKKEIAEKKKREETRKNSFATYRKNRIAQLLKKMFFNKKSKLNFITKSNRYKFDLKDISYINNEAVYTLTFVPKRREYYKGKIYVNTTNFAIVRVEYENVKPLGKFGLLGISYNKYSDKGKMIFSRDENQKYNLIYIENEKGIKYRVNRPLKIIEKNKHVKGRRKQNEVVLKFDVSISNVDKREVVIFNTNTITPEEFNTIRESKKIAPTYFKTYNPKFWKGYTIIEPNKAIREFTTIE